MATPVSLAASVDRDEYSQYEIDRNTITVNVIPTGVGTAGEQVLVQLMKARRNRDVEVAQTTITLSSNPTTSTQFYLPDIVDGKDRFSKVRRGSYFILVTSVSNQAIKGNSADFLISMVTVHRLKQDYLHGAHLRAYEVLAVHNQPQVITGVTINDVSLGHPQGWYELSYNIASDNLGSTVRTLSWCGGPEVPITDNNASYTLQLDDKSAYIDVSVPSTAALPATSVAENLLVEREGLSDTRIRQIINEATDWLEKHVLAVYLEPTKVTTEIDANELTYGPGTDIPTLIDDDFDEKVNALTYYRAAPGHWVNFKMPYKPLIRFDSLYGKVSNTRIIDIALEWVETHEKGGFVELVPFNQEVAFNFIGLIWVEALRGPVPIPNMWNFQAVVGLRQMLPTVLEVIAKKAAINILTIAGLAYRGGINSTSLSRDGVSESVSYLTAQQFGVYTGAINSYKMYIDETIPQLKGSLSGPYMTVMGF